jgi:hypothetical protein
MKLSRKKALTASSSREMPVAATIVAAASAGENA